jgi:hypothetical protein
MISPDDVIKLVDSKKDALAHSHMLIDAFEGNLTKYIIEDLKKQLTPQTLQQQMFRLSPINMLPKIVDKLTNIYQTGVTREVFEGTETDKELLAWYVDNMGVNDSMNAANELYNLTKATLVYPYVSKGVPKLRVILNDRFVLGSNDTVDPTNPTVVTLLAEKVEGVDIFWTWTADQFVITDSNADLRLDLMAKMGNPGGINPIGRLPFVYVNESRHYLYPRPDTDLMTMIKLLPIMCSDLNLAAMFQCFSILYTIDVNSTDLVFAPNAVWPLKSDLTSDKKPEIGTIKPQVDYDQVLNLIQSQLSVWLSTKGIRAGSIGMLTQDNFASGISKLIDEMDTFEARQKQVAVFQKAEKELWDLTLNFMHPYWSDSGMIDNSARFTPSAEVYTTFAIQLPAQQRGQVVRDLKEEVAAGFISRKGALAKLNPELSSEDIENLMKEIEDERGVVEVEEPSEPVDAESN